MGQLLKALDHIQMPIARRGGRARLTFTSVAASSDSMNLLPLSLSSHSDLLLTGKLTPGTTRGMVVSDHGNGLGDATTGLGLCSRITRCLCEILGEMLIMNWAFVRNI